MAVRRDPSQIRFVGSFPNLSALPPPSLPEVAFAGRSNVGKSSAINALLGRKALARVSRTPGRTQAINLIDVAGQLMVVDLPGYGYAKVPDKVRSQWKGLVEGYLGQRPNLKLVVALVDARLPAQALDVALVAGLADAGIPVVGVATKIDRVNRAARKPTLNALSMGLGIPGDALIPFSSVNREGVAELWDVLDQAMSL